MTLKHYTGSTTVRRQLERLPLETYNAILILADEDTENNVMHTGARSLSL